MKIRTCIQNSEGNHQVKLEVNNKVHTLSIQPQESGFGSSVNGGELLLLALATCYCNDIYREAGKLGIQVTSVDVEVDAEFGSPGEPARNITYRARVRADENADAIRNLMQVTDRMAEIQNTLRLGLPVTLLLMEAESEAAL